MEKTFKGVCESERGKLEKLVKCKSEDVVGHLVGLVLGLMEQRLGLAQLLLQLRGPVLVRVQLVLQRLARTATRDCTRFLLFFAMTSELTNVVWVFKVTRTLLKSVRQLISISSLIE